MNGIFGGESEREAKRRRIALGAATSTLLGDGERKVVVWVLEEVWD